MKPPTLHILPRYSHQPPVPTGEGPGIVAWHDAEGALRALGNIVDGRAWLHVLALASFHLNAPANRVVAVPYADVDPRTEADAIRDRFERTALPLALHVRGWTVLHASAVEGPRGVLGLLGPSTTGKSTLAHALTRRGYAAWADDALALPPGATPPVSAPLPSRPRLRAAAARHFGSPERGSDDAPAIVAPSGPRPLAGLVLLAQRGGDAPHLDPLPAAEAFPVLLEYAHIFALDDDTARRRYFAQLLAVATAVPVARLRAPDDLEQLPDVIALLEAYTFEGVR